MRSAAKNRKPKAEPSKAEPPSTPTGEPPSTVELGLLEPVLVEPAVLEPALLPPALVTPPAAEPISEVSAEAKASPDPAETKASPDVADAEPTETSPVNYDDEGLGEVEIEGAIYRFDSGKQGTALCLSRRSEGAWRWNYLGELRWDGRDLRSRALDRRLLSRLSESLRSLAERVG